MKSAAERDHRTRSRTRYVRLSFAHRIAHGDLLDSIRQIVGSYEGYIAAPNNGIVSRVKKRNLFKGVFWLPPNCQMLGSAWKFGICRAKLFAGYANRGRLAPRQRPEFLAAYLLRKIMTDRVE